MNVGKGRQLWEINEGKIKRYKKNVSNFIKIKAGQRFLKDTQMSGDLRNQRESTETGHWRIQVTRGGEQGHEGVGQGWMN